MIVKCDQCQTRFKIPDEKVTDKGVKVRCTKCANTFRVTRDMAVAGSGTGSIASSSSTAPTNLVPAIAPVSSDSKPASFLDPVDAEKTRRASVTAPASFLTSSDDESEKTRRGVFALGIEASKVSTLGSPKSPAKPAAKPGFDFASLVSGPGASAPKKPAAPSPFDFGGLVPAPSPAAPPRQVAAAPAAAATPFDFSGLSPAPSPAAPPASKPAPAPFDFSALGPAPVPAKGGAPAAANSPLAFDFSSLGPTSEAPPPPAPAAPKPVPAPPGAGPPPAAFDFSALGPTPVAPELPPAAPPAAEPERQELFADLPSMDSGIGPAEDVDLSAPSGGLPAPAPLPTMPASLEDDLFDQAAAEAARSLEDAQKPKGVAVAKIALVKGGGSSATDSAAGPASRPGGSAGGIFVNIVVGLLLVAVIGLAAVAVLNDGKLDSGALALKPAAGAGQFIATDISNGLYDTKLGKPVFYVRGEVTNNGATTTKVRVRAEIIDGAKVIRGAEVLAGAPPTPEQLRALSAVDEADRLLAAVSKSAPAIGPGETAPFLVTFFEYPPDLQEFRVRVIATPEKAPTAAREAP